MFDVGLSRCPPRGPCSPVRSVRSVFKVRPLWGPGFLVPVAGLRCCFPPPFRGGGFALFAVRAFLVVPVPQGLLKPPWVAAAGLFFIQAACARLVLTPFLGSFLFPSGCIFALNADYSKRISDKSCVYIKLPLFIFKVIWTVLQQVEFVYTGDKA